MRLLIIGGSGLIGGKLTLLSKDRHEVYSTFYSRPFELAGCKTLALDIGRGGQTISLIREVNPDWVVLASALTDEELCETVIDRTEKINGIAPGYVASACESVNARLLFLSTDNVFDGEAKGPYVEEDEPRPLNIYGSTKLEGERSVQHNSKEHLIARSCMVYGWPTVGGQGDFGKAYNFVTWVVTKLRRREKVRVAIDHSSTPTFADNLAESLIEIMERDLRGLLHIAGKSLINEYEFAVKIAKTFNLDETLISPCKIEELGFKAPRPRNSGLDTSKAQQALKTGLLNPDEGLVVMKTQWEQ